MLALGRVTGKLISHGRYGVKQACGITSEPVTRQTSIDEIYFTVGILTLGISIVPDHVRSVLGSMANRPRK